MEISVLSDEERAQLKNNLILKQKLHKSNRLFKHKEKRKLSNNCEIQNQSEEKKRRTIQSPSKEIVHDPLAQNKVEKKEEIPTMNIKQRRTLITLKKHQTWKNKAPTNYNNSHNNNDNKDPSNKRNSHELSKLQTKMQEKLKEGHFRYLNEKLYTSTSNEAFQFFQKNPQLFFEYHTGFENQVTKWPTNPVDIFIKEIQSQPSHFVVADFGCGSAKIAQSVPHKVHSFDLVACNDYVTVCDMAHVPLPDKSIDIAIFSLSLMGTNIVDFLKEANRVLKIGGELKIAEVKSRFEDLNKFIELLENLGFRLLKKDESNKMFVLLYFRKESSPQTHDYKFSLKPCKYKKR